MEYLSSLFLILFFTSIPIVLWGYGSEYLAENSWNRYRFFAGAFAGTITVGLLFVMREVIQSESFFIQAAALGLFFSILIGFAFLAIRRGSLFVRGFLEKILMLHGIILGFLLFLIVACSFLLPPSVQLGILVTLVPILMAAAIEESSKHIAALGMNAQDYRFSKKDMLAFSFFISLGFFMIENIIYLSFLLESGAKNIFIEGLTRIIFSLSIHVLSAGMIALFWWRALSYQLFSIRYSFLFISGVFLSVGLHSAYNILSIDGSLMILLLFPLATYILLSYHFSYDHPENIRISRDHDTRHHGKMEKV